jgi:hypothetical protein
LSFAGEDRAYAERVATALRRRGIRVFYDRYEQVELWGKDLYSHLDYVYRHSARYCVLFISAAYGEKLWTNHERRSAQARAFSENKEYVLPVRFDDTEIPGLAPTVGYLDVCRLNPRDLASRIVEKLGSRQRTNFWPPSLDRLYRRLKKRNKVGKERISSIAYAFFEAFKRMSPEERKVISAAFLFGCHAELPENVHISLDFLRRITSFPPAKIKRILGSLRSLGLVSSLRQGRGSHDGSLGQNTQAVIEFASLTSAVKPGNDETKVAVETVRCAAEDFCEECGFEALMRADFSQLASVTFEKETHKIGQKKRPLTGPNGL